MSEAVKQTEDAQQRDTTENKPKPRGVTVDGDGERMDRDDEVRKNEETDGQTVAHE